MRKRFFLTLVLLAAPLAAQFPPVIPMGYPVDDVGNKLTHLSQLAKAVATVEQLLQIYSTVDGHHRLAVAQAQMILGKLRWSLPAVPWQMTAGASTYGLPAPWYGAVNSGAGANLAYQLATEALRIYSMGGIPGVFQPRMMRQYSAIEIADAANQTALRTIGQYRAEQAMRSSVISSLMSTANSDGAADNTQIGVLNQIANSQAVSLQNTHAANAIQAAILEQMTVQATRARETQAIETNAAIDFWTSAGPSLHSDAVLSEALHGMRIP